MIDALIEKISVYGNRFIWKLKLDDNESNEEPVLLTSIIITKEKIKRLASQLKKKIKSCDNIFVDIYI